MLAFLQRIWRAMTGKIVTNNTQNGEFDLPSTNAQSSRNGIPLLYMLWHGISGKFFVPTKIPDGIEQGCVEEQQQHHENTKKTASKTSQRTTNKSKPDHLMENACPDGGQIHVDKSFAEEVVVSFVSQSIFLIPIAFIGYVNNFKQMEISIENNHQKLGFSTKGCFAKGCTLKNLLPADISCGDNAQIVFEKRVTNVKMAIKGVLTFDIHLSEKGEAYHGKATLVIWWTLPTISKNKVAIGIVNSSVDASKSLYKRMKHEQEQWFRSGVVYEIVRKEFPNVLGKYDVNITAQINDQNHASCRVDIG